METLCIEKNLERQGVWRTHLQSIRQTSKWTEKLISACMGRQTAMENSKSGMMIKTKLILLDIWESQY